MSIEVVKHDNKCYVKTAKCEFNKSTNKATLIKYE